MPTLARSNSTYGDFLWIAYGGNGNEVFMNNYLTCCGWFPSDSWYRPGPFTVASLISVPSFGFTVQGWNSGGLNVITRPQGTNQIGYSLYNIANDAWGPISYWNATITP
jgi:hypothetical protein